MGEKIGAKEDRHKRHDEKLRKGEMLFHQMQDNCKHDWTGQRAFADGNGFEQVCAKCGMGAMQWTLRNSR